MLICYISSLVQYLLILLHILLKIIGLLVFCMYSEFKSLLEICFTNIFCQLEACLSILSRVSFEEQVHFIFMKSKLYTFLAFYVLLKKFLPMLCLSRFCPMFSSDCFTVIVMTHMTHFKLDFTCGTV